MTYKAVKVDKDNYEWLLRESTKLQYETDKKSSLNDAITQLRKEENVRRNRALLELAGSWTMTDKEAEEFMLECRPGRRRVK